MPYIDLDRRFQPFKEDHDPEELPTSQFRYWGGLIDGVAWEELLQNPFVVVLGEAGSGKTSEFEAQVERIRQDQRFAFFVRAEDLVDGRFSDAVDPDDHKILETWRYGNDEALFFVDAVDEARIAHQANVFDKVLTKLRGDLADAKSRARFVISCRVSDWNPHADLQTFKAFIARCRLAEDGKAQEPRLVTLLPLDAKRARNFAAALGVADTDEFMTAVDRAGLDAYSSRPRDVEWLVAFWKEKHRFGSLTEMMEANIAARLREENEQRTARDPLSPDRARTGAEALAAAATLGKTFTIALPHSAAQSTEVGRSANAEHALPDWTRAEIDALLTRAIFDPATLGRVRFHHRSTQEYLAACWLIQRQAEGVPFDRIRDLVIGEVFGTDYAVPSMHGVAGWLASKLPELRHDLMKVAPEIPLFEGDSAQFPIEDREAILRRLASRFRSGMRLPWGYGGSPYHRFADRRLAPPILQLLQSERDQIHTIDLLLRLVEAGRIAECADAALAIARDETSESGTRALAIRAAASSGDDQTRQALRDLACSAAAMEEYVALAHFDALFPMALDAKQCLGIAEKLTKPLSPHRSHRFNQSVVERCPPSQLPALLEGLLDLACRKPMITCYDMLSREDTGVISQRFVWCADAIYAVLKRLHTCDAIAANAAELIARAHERLIRCQDLLATGRLPREPDVPLQWPVAIRKAIFRRIAASFNDLGFLSVVLVWWHKGWFRLTGPDLSWLVHEVSAVDDPPTKASFFELILNVWRSAGRPEGRVAVIRAALENCNPDAALRSMVEQWLERFLINLGHSRMS